MSIIIWAILIIAIFKGFDLWRKYRFKQHENSGHAGSTFKCEWCGERFSKYERTYHQQGLFVPDYFCSNKCLREYELLNEE